MSFDLGKLFIDWRRIVPNGVPNPNNDYHLVLLKEICLSRGIDKDVVNNVILALEKKEIDPDTPVKYKVGDKDQETTYGKAIVRDKDSEAYKAAKELEDKESGEKKDDKDSASVAGPELGNIKKYLGSDDENDIDDSDSQTQSQVDKKPQANGYVGDKDKTVSKGNPSETEEYQKDHEPDDEEFDKRR